MRELSNLPGWSTALLLLLELVLWVDGAWRRQAGMDTCARRSCYPATGDLLLGRTDRLHSSSTCGLHFPQKYCIVGHLSVAKKCFQCDSRRPYHPVISPLSHGIENVVTSFAPHPKNTWWQSENGEENVSIQLDLEAEFHFTHLVMTFKTFRPAAMLIERSADFGKTWKPYRYFAHNCASAFPGVPSRSLIQVDDIVCESRYSDIEPSSHGEVIFRVLDPAIRITDPYSKLIQDLLRITNLRINFTRLHTLGDNLLDPRPNVQEKYYYAVYDMVIRGNCFCYGHASQCAPVNRNVRTVDNMVHGKCVCVHHTMGLNCEQCKNFYQDLPWRPAKGTDANKCKKCNCNGHSNKCHFDKAVFITSGNVSGGVCDDCQHNTAGHHCHLCRPFYYRHPRRDARSHDACIPCVCDERGTQNAGQCDSLTNPALGQQAGRCHCKPNVEGQGCDRCKPGHFGLHADDPLGCRPCQCSSLGTIPGTQSCDPVTGACHCKRLVGGRRCDHCLPGHWGLSYDLLGCRPCDCDVGGALDNTCSFTTGQCRCRNHISGSKCTQVDHGYFLPSLDYYTYEAEETVMIHGVSVEPRKLSRDLPSSWTGIGFARVPAGGRLEFHVNNLPYSMEYEVIIRYELQLSEEWEDLTVQVIRPGPVISRSVCGNTIPSDDHMSTTLPAHSRLVVLPHTVCLEKGHSYTIRIEFKRYTLRGDVPNAFVLVDSLLLIPNFSSLEMFIAGDAASSARRDAFERHRCQEGLWPVIKRHPPPTCTHLLSSMAALVHNGSLACYCHPEGSMEHTCKPDGGQCPCRPHVIGRRCDQCAAGSYNLGQSGCTECQCDPRGSMSLVCEPRAGGRCTCRQGVVGHHCDRCLRGFWGFPECRQCHCRGHADTCDARTGACLGCRDRTAGDNCESCAPGYYGNPTVGESCLPCSCPEGPETGRHFASSCSVRPQSHAVICTCLPGYMGPRCQKCAPGHFGDISRFGGHCQPCQCHGNIDSNDPNSCDQQTGVCLRCLHNTEGPACRHCRVGFFGDATTQSCHDCHCNTRGTDPARCPAAISTCYCDPLSGQCPCLSGVQGRRCELCQADHWGFEGGRGCSPCHCHPVHSLSSECNEADGQCHCRPDFGGRTCNECEDNHWGDPRVKCQVCECDPRGAVSMRCHVATGECECRAGFTGPRCNRCARGFMGAPPMCQPCHKECFTAWDATVIGLSNEAQMLTERARQIGAGGVTEGPYTDRLVRLNRKLERVRELVAKRNATLAEVTRLSTLIDDVRREEDELTAKLEQLERALSEAEDRNNAGSSDLSELERDARATTAHASDLDKQLKFIKNSDFWGAVGSIRESAQQSQEAEMQARHAVEGWTSPVARSALTRQQAEEQITTRQPEFERNFVANDAALHTLRGDVAGLDLTRLNQQVCGSSGDIPCIDSTCGGIGCMDFDGQAHCGGMGCGGVVTAAASALERSNIGEQEIEKAMVELGNILQQVSAVKHKAIRAKARSQDALRKASIVKQQVQSSGEHLRDLVKQMKEFLSQESANPDSIEYVAGRVMQLTIPASEPRIASLTTNIKARVRSLANVDAILARTAGSVHQAARLLREARRARSNAENVRNATVVVKDALSGAKVAQMAAELAIRQAQGNVQDTRNTLGSMDSQIGTAHAELREVTRSLAAVSRAVDRLKLKTASNSFAASKANHVASSAKLRAAEAKQTNDGAVRDKFNALNDLVDKKSGGMDGAHRRVEVLRAEAQKLMQDAENRLRRLADLESLYDYNAQLLQNKAMRLQGLESGLRNIVDAINRRITIYNTCH
uniref:laminin subunit beta-2-like isoform X2 n=1 Tax=Myxine glutinosa TaxID=7769 RepID=UPI00358E9050